MKCPECEGRGQVGGIGIGLEEIFETIECETCEGEGEIDDLTCPQCNGSGEGMHDGTKCPSCKGSGVESVEKERR